MSADGAVTTAAGALAQVAQIKDIASFVVLTIVLLGIVGILALSVWKVVPPLVAFLRSQEQAMNAIVVKLTEIDAKLCADGESTRAHVTEEVTTGARHPIRDAIDAAAHEAIQRDAATIERVASAHEALAELVRSEHRETRAALREAIRDAHH